MNAILKSYKFRACIILAGLLLSTTSCDTLRLRYNLSRIMKGKIVLPDNVRVAFDGEVLSMDDSLRIGPKMIIYIDSTECSMCRLSKLVMYDPLYKLSKESNAFRLVILIPPQKVQGMDISRIVADMEYGIPVYIDEDNAFLNDNPSIPSDLRLHSFFVDEGGNPIFVGDPVMNPGVYDLLVDYLDK